MPERPPPVPGPGRPPTPEEREVLRTSRAEYTLGRQADRTPNTDTVAAYARALNEHYAAVHALLQSELPPDYPPLPPPPVRKPPRARNRPHTNPNPNPKDPEHAAAQRP